MSETPAAPRPGSPPVHLSAAGLASLLFVALLLIAHHEAGTEARRAILRIAPRFFPQKNLGTLLQQSAFDRPDLLPIYGSSELVETSPFQASETFRSFPTGFALFPVGDVGVPPLSQVERLGAIAGSLRGRKVVLSLTPAVPLWRVAPHPHRKGAGRPIRKPNHVSAEEAAFIMAREGDPYTGSFSALQAERLVFGHAIALPLRRQIASRMLAFPASLKEEPVLSFGLLSLTRTDLAHRMGYLVSTPLGQLESSFLSFGDDFRVLVYLREQSGETVDTVPRPAGFDWPTLAAQAEAGYRAGTSNNAFGLDTAYWRKYQSTLRTMIVPYDDSTYLEEVSRPETWTDITLILEMLTQAGARPLIVSMPLAGLLGDSLGLSRAARHACYARLREIAARYHVPVVDFEDHDEDRWFLFDAGSHPSPKGWVYYDQALDAFYHDTLH